MWEGALSGAWEAGAFALSPSLAPSLVAGRLLADPRDPGAMLTVPHTQPGLSLAVELMVPLWREARLEVSGFVLGTATPSPGSERSALNLDQLLLLCWGGRPQGSCAYKTAQKVGRGLAGSQCWRATCAAGHWRGPGEDVQPSLQTERSSSELLMRCSPLRWLGRLCILQADLYVRGRHRIWAADVTGGISRY